MMLLGDAFFMWRSSGPNLWIGAIVTMAIIGLGYLWCRTPKGHVVGIILFGAWTLYSVFVFVAFKIWPDEISINSEQMHGRHDLSQFDFKVADIRSVRGSRSPKGGYGLHVFLKSTNKAVGIPVIWDKDKEAYKNALHKVCPDVDFDW